MALPTGWSIQVNGVRAQFDATGKAATAAIDYAVLDATGAQVGISTHTLAADGPTAIDSFTGDGAATTFTTTQAPYGGALMAVRLGGATQTSGYTTATNANGTIAVAFATAPAGPVPASGNTPAQPGELVELVYSTGPGLWNAAGDLTSVLGLTAGNGTVYQGGGQASAHQHVCDAAGLLAAWGKARVLTDKF